MDENKKYLNDLKQELTQYKKQLSTIKDSFKGNTNNDTNQIYDSLKNILKEAGESYRKLEEASAAEWEPLKKIASNSFEQLQKQFEEYKDIAVDQLKQYTDQIEEYSQEAIDMSAEYIQNNPLKSVLIAAGAGFVIGRILK
jgi:ElaB/YqjD/DUF883 family membrane-anchored ribosome-binding protein